jgi:TnpA family transposase
LIDAGPDRTTILGVMNTLFEPPQHHPARLRHNAVVNTHGASVVGFALTDLLEFRLLPRLKNIGAIKLYSPDDAASTWPALEKVIVNRPNNRELIEQRYDRWSNTRPRRGWARPRPNRRYAGSPRAAARRAPPTWRWRS